MYSQTKGLGNKAIAKAVAQALEQGILEREYLPEKLRRKYQLAEYNYAIQHIHFPSSEAQMLAARGIIKGDTVLLSLRCHYEFWFTILALHKLGAVAVPVSHTLTVQELLRRFQVTGITACVVSGEGITAQAVEEAC